MAFTPLLNDLFGWPSSLVTQSSSRAEPSIRHDLRQVSESFDQVRRRLCGSSAHTSDYSNQGTSYSPSWSLGFPICLMEAWAWLTPTVLTSLNTHKALPAQRRVPDTFHNPSQSPLQKGRAGPALVL